MHSSATAQILDHSIDYARFGVRFHNGEVGHDTLQQRYQRLLTAEGFDRDSAELKKLRRRITKSSIRYQQYRVAAIMAPFFAFFGLTIVKVAAEESMPEFYLMFIVAAGFAYVVWRDYPRGLAMEHAHKADRILVGFEATSVDSDESTDNAIEWSSRIPVTSSRANAEKNRLLASLLFGEAVRAGTITTAALYDRYLDQRSRADAATHKRELRAVKRNLALTDVPRLRLLILATFALLVAALHTLQIVTTDESLVSALVAAALAAAVLYAALRSCAGKSPVTAMATGLALSNGQRADAFLAGLEQNQRTDN
ncbi:hypothetical protein [Rhodococcus sp. BH5]|uniref:hypothetical protein n=1 Tax=Rhodococcus sp. BH5 TaxID=2871702 RepID=UPI0022CD9AC1|nr:hypothetical protein [Rhodococcus sp. BH5]MCZ9635021.1 hypothetical protein [Rhodococcus sp. BH5]